MLTALYSAMKTLGGPQPPQPPKGSRYVLAFNKVSYEGADPKDNEPIIKQIRQLEAQRLQMLDVRPMKHLKNFAQIPQVIHEMGVAVDLAHRKKQTGRGSAAYWKSKRRYSERLKLWQEDFSSHYLLDPTSNSGKSKFANLQKQVSQELQATLDEIMKRSIELTAISDELAIHLWARSYSVDTLEFFLWAGNEYAQQRTVPKSLSRRVEHSKFDIPLRQAFEGVSSRGLLPAAEHSRWAQIMGVPVISKTTKAEHKYGRLLLGIVTLSTDLPPVQSDLSDCLEERGDLVGQIEESLVTVGHRLLVDSLC